MEKWWWWPCNNKSWGWNRALSWYKEDFSIGALAQGIYFGEEQNYTAFPLRLQMLEEFRVSQAREDFIRVHEIFCRCGLFIGVHIVQLHGYRRSKSKRKNIKRIENWRYQMYIDRVFIVERYMTLIRGRELYIPLLDLPPNVIVLENLLGRLEDGYLSISPRMKIVYICKGILRTEHHGTRLCENVIFEHRSILSDQHFWQLPRDGNVQDIQNAENDGASNTYRRQHEELMDRNSDDNNENAYYVNHVESPLQTVQQRNLDLLQGNMTIADIACNRCGQLIGWRFIKSLENDRNHEYEGRWGFVISSVRKEMKHHMRTYFECPIEFISRP